ncbi:hypothetical protein EI693_20365 [Pseudomonas oryziphila]|uniref:Integron gene cassette protein n=1 Tax=Pseudomonas oryziphila TaxID=2894079 RepID=A0ABN5TMZ5_9PSED|nr:hypothetical protein EI693_20365 [Pseudomonas oryziphila]
MFGLIGARSRSAFGVRRSAFGVRRSAFGSECVGFDRCMRIRRRCRLLVTFPPLRRVTLVLAKVTKAARSHHAAPALRSGVPSLRCLTGPRGLRLAAQVYISRLRLRRRVLRTRALQSPPLGLLKSQFVLPGLLRA